MSDFFNKKPAAEPPPPDSEGDYGENVVKLKKRERPGWKGMWQIAESGQPLPNLRNAMIVLRYHPKLANIVRYDEMARSAILVKQIPNTAPDPSLPHPIRDADILSILEEVQLTGLRRLPKATAQDAIMLQADQDRFHPIRQYLNAIVWDATPRVDGWLSYYLGTEPEPDAKEEDRERKRRYFSMVGRLFLIAMVARIIQPGCKADYMLILEGPQGALKSSACRVLAGEWFSDNLPDLSRGDAVRLSMHLRGKWLIEIAELSSFNAAESHTLKEFLTQTEERYTPKYGRNEVIEPRQCLFIGSTNERTYLRDATGARRFWPARVGNIDIPALEKDRDQLLAEAVHLYRAGEPWWPDREFEAEVIVPEQAARYEEDPWHELIEKWIGVNARTRVTVNEILKDVLSLPAGQFGTREQRRVSAILLRMGWNLYRTNNNRFYEKPSAVRNV